MNSNPNIEGVDRNDDFGPGYIKTEDERMLIERADFAVRFLKGHPGEADPLEMLEAVVWPSEEMLQAQRDKVSG